MISLYLMGIVGIEKECIDTTEYSGLGRQRVVDSDCAALFKINNKLFVADHNYQGFWRIRFVKPGDITVLKKGSEGITYVCTSVEKGINNGKDLIDSDGKTIWSLQNRSISIDEAKAILNECGVTKDEVIVIPIHQPYSSYMYEIDDAYCKYVTQLFR